MLLSLKFEIFPTEEQKETLDRWLQYCRQTYNSALLDKQRKYKENKQPYSRFDMQQQQKIDKHTYAYLKEMPSQPLQEVFLRLEKAYRNFFRGDAKLYNKKLGEVDILFHRPLDGTVKQLVLKRQGKKWYAIFSVERQAAPSAIDPDNAVGIDVGINKYAVLSNGMEYENPRFLRKKDEQLKKAQRKLSKMKRGSANYSKQVMRVRQLHEKVANQRRDFLHKLSYRLTKVYSVVCVENLKIRNMVRNRKLSKSISDAGWGMFRNMLSYKCEKNGGILVKIEPKYTSQDCSSCNNRVKKSLSVRTHICTTCGTVLDRDYNASINILQKGLEQLLVAI